MSKRIFLAESHPKLATEAHGWDPNTITAGSGKSVEWKCSEGHVYKAPVYSRTSSSPTGCPYCSNRKVLAGFNDLQSTHPEIALEADGWDPTKYSAGMGKKVDWVCSKGHRYSSVIHSRTKGVGCPVCSNRKILVGTNDLQTTHPTIAKEAYGWDPKEFVAGSDTVAKWKCAKGHFYQSAIKNRALKNTNCTVCLNREVVAGVNDLLTTHPALANQAHGWDPTTVSGESHQKLGWQCGFGHTWKAMVNSRARGRDCPVCSNQIVLKGSNDLATTNPDIAQQAFEWDPSTVTAGTKSKRLWKCDKGHVWDAPVNTRFRESGHGCPFCSNHRLLVGYNDFATTHPHLLGEVDGWDPTAIIAGSRIKKSWKCLEGHTWQTSIGSRTGSKESGCPTCAKYGFDPNKNGWLYFLIQKQWGLLQIGITNVPEQRLKKHSNSGWELLDLKGPMDGFLAREWEGFILKYITNLGHKVGSKDIAGSFDGYTESWKISDFSPKTLAEIMDKVRDS